jgi:RNA polymerase sigma-70 factor (ECF subfamily)
MAAGDTRAVEAFYRQYFDDLYALARRFTGRDESFCLDVVQESVLRVIRSVQPAHTEGQFAAWLRLVVQTTAYDLLRSESRRQRRELTVAAAGAGREARDHGDVDSERLQWLRSQISSLDPQIIRLIELRFQDRWTLARIGEMLGLSTGAVDGRLRRALSELRSRAAEAQLD